MPKTITLKIAGAEIKADEGCTILDVARANDIFIPTLCSFKGLSNVGACRLCMVEVRGVPRLLPACATTIVEGMDVTVDSPKVGKYRKMILELLLASLGRVVSRPQLEAALYRWGEGVESNAIEVHIHHLRKKLGADFIQTRRGLGYLVDKP